MHFLPRAGVGLLALILVSTAWAQAERSAQAENMSQAERISQADARAIRSVIDAQLAAFAADDAEKAFSFATRGIHSTFATPENFIAMVKNTYPVVYRPASVLFFDAESLGDETLQRVQMSDDAGGLWIALYRMQRQTDGAWLIDGCVLAAVKGSRA